MQPGHGACAGTRLENLLRRLALPHVAAQRLRERASARDERAGRLRSYEGTA